MSLSSAFYPDSINIHLFFERYRNISFLPSLLNVRHVSDTQMFNFNIRLQYNMDIISLLARSNNDVYQDLFNILPITDKRSFIRTCKKNNSQSVYMPYVETKVLKMINKTHFLSNTRIKFYCKLHQYTVELLFDEYAIPDKYFIHENRILHQYPKIYKRLSKKGDLLL